MTPQAKLQAIHAPAHSSNTAELTDQGRRVGMTVVEDAVTGWKRQVMTAYPELHATQGQVPSVDN